MPSTLEIAYWPASEAYQKDPGLVNDFVVTSAQTTGVQRVYTGLQVEKPNGYLVIAWDDFESHQRAIADKKRFAVNGRKLVPAMAAPRAGVSLFHGVFADSARLERVLSAPVTEIVEVSPRDISEKGRVKDNDLLARMEKITNSGGKDSVAIAGVGGPIVERAGDWVVLVGWPSVEARLEDAKNGSWGEVMKDLRATCDVRTCHVKLRTHGSAKL